MNILITGAKGFIGKNLTENLKNIRDKKNCTRPNLQIENIYEYDLDSTPEELETYCKEADFIFNLAGVNRPKDPEEFKEGNVSFSSALLDTLEKCGSRATVMLSSSDSGFPARTFWYFRIWSFQKGRRGFIFCLWRKK